MARVVHAVAQIVLALATAILWWYGFVQDMPEREGLDGEFIEACKNSAPEVIVACGVLILTSLFFRGVFAPASKERLQIDSAIDESLDRFRDAVFNLPAETQVHENRVTIFKHTSRVWVLPWESWRCWCWPWGLGRGPSSGWLVIRRRSGHTTQKSSTIFLAPDDANHAEGVAGRAWSTKSPVEVNDLDPDKSNAYTVNLPPKWAERRRKKGKTIPKQLVALPLDTKDNRPWGVVVIDSSNDHQCKRDSRKFLDAFRRLKQDLFLLWGSDG